MQVSNREIWGPDYQEMYRRHNNKTVLLYTAYSWLIIGNCVLKIASKSFYLYLQLFRICQA